MSCAQIRVKKHFRHKKTMRVVLYLYMLWSDSSTMTVGGGEIALRNIMPANWPLKHLRSKWGYRRLAQLPVVNPDLGCAVRPSSAL